MLNNSQKKVKRKELAMTWVLFLHVYVFIINEVGCTGQLVQFTTPELCSCVGCCWRSNLSSAPPWPELMTHSSPSGGRVSGHDEPVCHFHQSPRERYLARHQHQPQHQIYTLYTIFRQGRIIKLKQKIWWTYLNVEKTKEALLVCVSGPVFLSRRKITKPLLT